MLQNLQKKLVENAHFMVITVSLVISVLQLTKKLFTEFREKELLKMGILLALILD